MFILNFWIYSLQTSNKQFMDHTLRITVLKDSCPKFTQFMKEIDISAMSMFQTNPL